MSDDRTDASGDDPDIGGPEGGKTRSHMHFQVLPRWTAPQPAKFELTDREKAIAEIAAYKNAAILRRVIWALAVVVAIGGCGTTAGWYFVQREAETRAAAIQTNRFEVLVEGCLETNSRHSRTLERLDELYGGGAPTARQRQSRRSVTLLVDALQPYRKDCEAYARSRLKRAAK